jgi:hypothetical protein
MVNADNLSTTWRLEQAGNEKMELIDEGAIGHDNLQSFMIYRLFPPPGESLEHQDKVSLEGTLTCACGYEMALKTTIGFKGFLDALSKYPDTCPRCHRSMMLTGETTGKEATEKKWLLLTPTTGKPGVVEMHVTPSGLPEISIETVERITDEKEGLRRWEAALGVKPPSADEPSSEKMVKESDVRTGESAAANPDEGHIPSLETLEEAPVNDMPESIIDDRLPSEMINDLFNRQRIDPTSERILVAALLYEQEMSPYVWVSPGPDPYAVESESREITQLRYLISKVMPSFQPHFIPGHLKIDSGTLITGRQFEIGEDLDVGYINPMLAVMLADLLEDEGLLEEVELSKCSALCVSGNSVALGEARLALVVR